jgi:hypothetical protein
MANHPKLIKIEGPFLDALKKLLRTVPPPRSAPERKLLTKLEARRKRKAPAGAKKAGTRKKR